MIALTHLYISFVTLIWAYVFDYSPFNILYKLQVRLIHNVRNAIQTEKGVWCLKIIHVKDPITTYCHSEEKWSTTVITLLSPRYRVSSSLICLIGIENRSISSFGKL